MSKMIKLVVDILVKEEKMDKTAANYLRNMAMEIKEALPEASVTYQESTEIH